jgi:hypothetical protein
LLKTLLKMPSHPASHHPYNQHLVSEKSWLRGGPMLYTTVYNLSEKISLWYPLFIWFFDLYTQMVDFDWNDTMTENNVLSSSRWNSHLSPALEHIFCISCTLAWNLS